MTRLRFGMLALSVGLLVVLTACASRSDGDAAGVDMDEGNISADAPSGAPGQPELVPLQPDLADAVPHAWADTEVGADDRSMVVTFWSDPCTAVQRVELDYEAERIVVTLFAAPDPSAPQPCSQVAVSRAVRVDLTEPVRERPFVDGAGEAPSPPPGDAIPPSS